MNRTTVVRRVTLTGLAAAALVALGSTSATAHVTITPSTTAAGATAVLRVEVPHGCDGSATTAIAVRLPDGVADVTASGTDRWSVDQTEDALTFTIDEALPDDELAEVEFSARLTADVGATLVFPVVQRCEEGDAAWTEVAEPGADHDALDRPAPVVVVTPGDVPADVSADTDTSADTSAGVPGDTDDDPADDSGAATAAAAEGRDPAIAYGAAGLVAAGALAGTAVLLRRRRLR